MDHPTSGTQSSSQGSSQAQASLRVYSELLNYIDITIDCVKAVRSDRHQVEVNFVDTLDDLDEHDPGQYHKWCANQARSMGYDFPYWFDRLEGRPTDEETVLANVLQEMIGEALSVLSRLGVKVESHTDREMMKEVCGWFEGMQREARDLAR